MGDRLMTEFSGGIFRTKKPKRSTSKRGRIDLEGVEDLEAALKRMTEDVQGEHLRAAVTAGGHLVRDVARQLAPRSSEGSRGHSPGFLAENVDAEVQWTRGQDKAEIHIGMHKDAYYGWFQETGTTYHPAQPFLRPALDETKNQVIDEIADTLRARIFRGLR